VWERAIVLAAALVSTPVLAQASDRVCAPWPGEFSPLPSVHDSDPLRARWAELRLAQLAERATSVESQDRLEAYRLWQRALCFDAWSETARDGAARTRPRAVVSRTADLAHDLRDPVPVAAAPAPPVAAAPTPPVAAPTSPAAREATPQRVEKPAGGAERREAKAEPRRDWSAIDASLARAEALIRAARFDDALGLLHKASAKLGGESDPLPVRERRSRIEVLTATVLVAFGREGAARARLERALAAKPDLELDPTSTPPKLRRVFGAVQAAAGQAHGPEGVAGDGPPAVSSGPPEAETR
jgi:hypothetical protein